MPHNTQLDSLELGDLNLPYNRIKKDLSDDPRLITGSNCAITNGGKLVKRWGTVLAAANSVPLGGKRIDRLWIYENLTGVVYLLASMYDVGSKNWAMYYSPLTGAISWTSVGSLRSIDASTQAHEAVTSRGIFYIKGFPTAASGEKLGTISFDTNSGSVVVSTWGLLGPTTPAAIVGTLMRINQAGGLNATDLTCTVTSHSAPSAPYALYVDYEILNVTNDTGTVLTFTRASQGTLATTHANSTTCVFKNWTASTHPVTVNFYWQYSYAYKSLTGQVSNRAPLVTNPDNLPSSTGPVINLRPKITVTGQADTTNIPSIIIYRTTDGGGTFFQLETITNTGAGSITYEDKSLTSGSGNVDPLPDVQLSAGNIGTTLVSNGPPTTVVTPKVIGTDTPQPSCPLESYAGRIWIGIQNLLFYSANEELTLGVPEESWPSGSNGNFFRFSHPILNLKSTTYALYIVTSGGIYQMTGTTRETFNIRPVLTNVGGPFNHPRAIDRYGDAVVWVTSDYRVAILQGRLTQYGQDFFKAISDPLYTDLTNFVNTYTTNAELDVKYWADLEKEYIIVTGIHKTNPALTQQWVYDIGKSQEMKNDFWFVPWSINASALASGRISATAFQRRLLFNAYDTNNNNSIVMLDPTGGTATDIKADGSVGKYDASFTTGLMRVPPGDHVNERRLPALAAPVYEVRIDRTSFPPDEDPQVSYFKDDFWTDPIPLPLTPEDPARRDVSKGYRTMIYPINEVCQRVAFKVDKFQSREQMELQALTVVFNPDAGA